MIELNEKDGVETFYDYNTGNYIRCRKPQWPDIRYAWFIFQPFVIAATKKMTAQTEKYPYGEHLALTLLVFLAAAFITFVSCEVLTACYGETIKKRSEKISEPPEDVLAEWTKDFQKILRNVRNLVIVLTLMIAGLAAAFIKTGDTVFLTLLIFFYYILYINWVAARPNLLRRFKKEKTFSDFNN